MSGAVNLRLARAQCGEVTYWHDRIFEPWVGAMDVMMQSVPAMIEEIERLRRRVAILECNEVRPFAGHH